MNFILFYFMILIIIPAMLIVWGIRIVNLFKRKRGKYKYAEAGILLLLVGIITWNIGIFPVSQNFYVKGLTKEITGKEFWTSKEFAFDEISVRGEGYSILAYKYDEEMIEYFYNPNQEFFENYPQPSEHRQNWKTTKWRKTPIQSEENKVLQIATPTYTGWNQNKLDKMKLVKNLAHEDGSYYAYNTNGSDVDFYVINPNEELIIIINHNQ